MLIPAAGNITPENRQLIGIDLTGQLAIHHFVQMTQEAETGNVGTAVDVILLAALGSILVEAGHGFDGLVHGFLSSLTHTVSGTDDANTQFLGDDQLVTGMAAIVGVDLVRVNSTHDRQTVLNIHIVDRVTANQHTAGFDDFLTAAAEDLTQHIDIPALGETDDIHGSLYFTAHGINVAEGVGGSDLAEGIGIIHHGREEVHSLNDTDIIRHFINSCIVGTVEADQQIGVILALGQLA